MLPRHVAPQNNNRPCASAMINAFMAFWRDSPEMNRCRPARFTLGRRTSISIASINPVNPV
ncbi:hypothetical protein UO65_0067 [Actinokineospora spheciospongiae]|uniref:Uncharacterized protein n=1 Tax=Actinokineospora spheciospongiae TaxID=909613 RepID=W7IU50_9PSEU|nr:hypothetical protein UO65_0067 [Actinokineospora spheciospongiae]